MAKPSNDDICILCDGSGRTGAQDRHSRAVKAGNASYVKSLEPGQLSMRERGRKGGRPRRLTLADLVAWRDTATKGGAADSRVG